MSAYEVVCEAADYEFAVVRAGEAHFLVCGYQLDDDEVQRPDVRYPLSEWPTAAEAWAFGCGYQQGSWDNM